LHLVEASSSLPKFHPDPFGELPPKLENYRRLFVSALVSGLDGGVGIANKAIESAFLSQPCSDASPHSSPQSSLNIATVFDAQ
jgi:hypothetical protein